MKTLCIYHANCADGFGAAWAVWKALGDRVEFHPGVYGAAPPDVDGRNVVLVDFSYKRAVLEDMAWRAASLLILDHHKTAEAELDGIHSWAADLGLYVTSVFDMKKSGAVLAWEYFHKDREVPTLLLHIQDRDLWKFDLPGTREAQAAVFSYPYDFQVWDGLVSDVEDIGIARLVADGQAIERKHHKDISELLAVTTRPMTIGGYLVPVANLPYTLASDAGNALCRGVYDGPGGSYIPPFAGTYFDRPDGRVFSLRSIGDFDVSAVAKTYGGGGHKNAAGFIMPLGWSGDVTASAQ